MNKDIGMDVVLGTKNDMVTDMDIAMNMDIRSDTRY
jgi:hypothetical protein